MVKKDGEAADAPTLSKYAVERKVELADIGLSAPPTNGNDGNGAVRAAVAKLGDVWVSLGEYLARSPEQAMQAALEALGDKAPESITLRAVAKRYLSDPTTYAKKVTTTWEGGR